MTLEPLLRAERFYAGPQPTLRGDGLVLRPWRADEADAAVAVRAFADPAIARWHVRSLSGTQAPGWIAERRARWRGRAGGDWAVTADDGADGLESPVLGRVGLHGVDLRDGVATVAYWVLPEARGARVAPRALTVLSEWAFTTQNLHRLVLEHSVGNEPSCRVAAKAGFALEGTERSAMRHADGWHDMHLHARIAGD